MIFTTKPNRREVIFGTVYLLLYLLVLPSLISLVNVPGYVSLSDAQLNFLFFCVNFLAVLVIFRKYLLQSLRDALAVPFPTIWYAILGCAGNSVLSNYLHIALMMFFPWFFNVNDSSISQLLGQDRTLMFIGTIFLVPVTEELLFRGLIFRSLYDRSPLKAHLVTMVAFSAIHVLSYVGSYEPVQLLLCFIQYLPAAYCLNFSYRYGGTILSPILMHVMTNIFALSAMR